MIMEKKDEEVRHEQMNKGELKNGIREYGTRKKKKRFVRDIQMRRKRL